MEQICWDSASFSFEFMKKKKERDLGSNSRWSIAWMDENGKCFFPELIFISEDLDNTNENMSPVENSGVQNIELIFGVVHFWIFVGPSSNYALCMF